MHSEGSNVGQTERIVSAVAGGTLIGLGVWKRSPLWFALAALGVELVRRGISGKCYVCARLGRPAGGWRRNDERIDAMSMESFPASDAPAY